MKIGIIILGLVAICTAVLLSLTQAVGPTSRAAQDVATWRVAPTGGFSFEITRGNQVAATMGLVHWGPDWKWYEFPKSVALADDGTQTAKVAATVPSSVAGTQSNVVLDYRYSTAPDAATWSYDFTATEKTPIVGSVLEVTPDANFFAGGKVKLVLPGGGSEIRDWPLGTTDAAGPFARVEFVAPGGESFAFDLKPGSIVAGQGDAVRIYLAKDEFAVGSTGPRTITLTASGAAAFGSAAPRPAVVDDLSTWFPYRIDKSGPPLDLSFLNKDAAGKFIPAGKDGFVKIIGEHFAFADNSRAKFWGVNVTAGALTDSPARGKEIADRLAKMGVNLVRIHHMDSWHKPIIDTENPDGTTQNLNLLTLETIDSFVKELNARGIYVKPDPWVQRFFRENDGVAAWEKFEERNNHHLHPYVFFDPKMQELIRKQFIGMLSHVGQSTGISMFNNPGIAFFQVANEALMQRGGGHVEHEPYRSAFVKFFNAWQLKNNLPVGGDPVGNNYSPEHQKFYIDLMRNFYASMNKAYREVGAKVPIGTSNWMVWAWELRSQSKGEFMDAHHYYGGDKVGPGGELGRLWTLDAPGRTNGPFGPIAASRIVGKPMMISEVGDNPPKTFRAAYPIGLAVVSSLQGYDAIIGYAYSQTGQSFDKLDAFEWESDPVSVAMWSAASLIYRRGDIQPGKNVFTMHLTGGEQYAMHWEAENKRMFYNTPRFNQLLETSRVNVWCEDDGPMPAGTGTVITAQEAASYRPTNPIVSDTGELFRDFEKGFGSINTPRTSAAYGMVGGQSIKTAAATFDIATPFASVVLSSMTDEPIISSTKMLLITAARAQNTGRVANLSARRITDDGKGPVLCEPVTGKIAINTTHARLSVVALNADGTKQPPRVIDAVNGVVTISLEASAKTLFYEITAP